LRDGSGNFAAGTITATLSGTATQVSNALTAGTYLTSTGTYNGSTARTFAVDATDANTASKVVARDASGNFSAGTITASLTGSISGNAATATALQTARTINGVSFNGTADITVTAAAGTLTGSTLASGVTASSLTSVGTLGSLTVSGNLTVDTNTLFVDAANNRVGVGTASPSYILDVVGTGTQTVAVRTNTSGDPVLYFEAAGSNAGSVRYSRSLQALQLSGQNPTVHATVDSAGNLGLGVTPSAWGSNWRAVELQYSTSGQAFAALYPVILANAYNDNTNYIYKTTAAASYYSQVLGQHRWYNAPSGTAGNAITFTQAMTLDSSGNLLVGTTSAFFNSAGRGLFEINGSSESLIALKNNNTVSGYVRGASSEFLFVGNALPVNISATGANYIALTTNSVERARIDSSGNLGLGVTPSAIGGGKYLQVLSTTSFGQQQNGSVNVMCNAYESAANAFSYIASAAGSRYNLSTSGHQWFTAPSGTAGNAITFTQAMTLDASGRLGIGVTSPGVVLDVTAATGQIRLISSTGTNHVFGSYENTGGVLRECLAATKTLVVFSVLALIAAQAVCSRLARRHTVVSLRQRAHRRWHLGQTPPNALASRRVGTSRRRMVEPTLTLLATTTKWSAANQAAM
jgi:hypothetical protein